MSGQERALAELQKDCDVKDLLDLENDSRVVVRNKRTRRISLFSPDEMVRGNAYIGQDFVLVEGRVNEVVEVIVALQEKGFRLLLPTGELGHGIVAILERS